MFITVFRKASVLNGYVHPAMMRRRLSPNPLA
jgi:hypothetical protein